MKYTQPVNEQVVPYTTIKVDGCSDSVIGFQLLDEQPSISKRRYCNKVLVHECVRVPEISPLEVEHVEFIATADPCYATFSFCKSSLEVDDIDPTIEIQLNDDDLAIGVLVNFSKEETCGKPIRLSYRLYAYFDSDPREMLSQGNLYITPCTCSADQECETCNWETVNW